MKIEMKLYKGDKLLEILAVEDNNEKDTFHKTLQNLIVDACRRLNAPLPLWLSRNTREFAAFRHTVFFAEQFMEKTFFDRMQLRLLEE